MNHFSYKKQLVMILAGMLVFFGKQLLGQGPPAPGAGNFSTTGIIINGTLGGAGESSHHIYGTSCREDRGGYAVLSHDVELFIPDVDQKQSVVLLVTVKDGQNYTRATNFLGNVGYQMVLTIHFQYTIPPGKRPGKQAVLVPTISPAIPFTYSVSGDDLTMNFNLTYSSELPVNYPIYHTLKSIFDTQAEDLLGNWEPLAPTYYIHEQVCIATSQSRTAASPQTEQVSISPNPFSHTLRIKNGAEQEGLLRLRLFNANGVLLREDSMATPGEQLRWQCDHLPAGMYFVHLEDEAGNRRIQKLVKID